MKEENKVVFTGNWTGTGSIEGVGDAEKIVLAEGEAMESDDVVYTGVRMVTMYKNRYGTGDASVVLKYRHGASAAAAFAAEWNVYSAPFESLGYVQARVEYPA